MRRIYVELSDEEAKMLSGLLNFIKLKIGVKRAVIKGFFYVVEKEIKLKRKEKETLEKLRKQIGV